MYIINSKETRSIYFQQDSYLNKISIKLQIRCLKFLSPSDLANFSLASKECKDLASHPSLQKNFKKLSLIKSTSSKIAPEKTQDKITKISTVDKGIRFDELKVPFFSFDEAKMKQAVLKDWDNIVNRKPSNNFILYKGTMPVLEHTEFPGCIIKVTSVENAQKMLESITICQKAVKTDPDLKCCIIPETKVILLPEAPKYFDQEYALLVMEKIKGIIPHYASQEVSEQEFEQFCKQPEVEKKWRAFFRAAAEFICLTGYWDTAWRNILLMTNGFGFIDFEFVTPTQEKILGGISGLCTMAPPEFIDMIIEIASRHVDNQAISQFFTKESIFIFKSKRQDELALRSQVRAWHKTQNINEPFYKLNPMEWSEKSLERRILEQFNKKIANLTYSYEDSLIEQRKLNWQPFNGDLKGPYQDDFEKALKNLQSIGILCTWRKNECIEYNECTSYEIYF